jgi:hypothetical protein
MHGKVKHRTAKQGTAKHKAWSSEARSSELWSYEVQSSEVSALRKKQRGMKQHNRGGRRKKHGSV